MDLQITFRHMEHTPALDTQIREKAQKLQKWFGEGTKAHWTCFVEGRLHYSELQVHAGRKDYFAKASADDLYKTFDMVVEKIHNQIG